MAAVDALFAVVALSGATLVVFGVYTARTWRRPGSLALAASLVCLGLAGVTGGVAGVLLGPEFGDPSSSGAWEAWLNGFYLVATVFWILFAMQYTGQIPVDGRTATLISLPVAATIATLVVSFFSLQPATVPDSVLPFLFIIGLFYAIALVIIGIFLLLWTTAQYGHLTPGPVLALSWMIFGTWFLANLGVGFATTASETGAVGVAALSFSLATGCAGAAVLRYDLFESTPAAGNVGKRQIAREMDEMVVLTDDSEQVIELNEAVTDRLDVSESGTLASPIGDLLGADVDELRSLDTLALHTHDGHRQFDVHVSTTGDQHGHTLGYIVTLHDVTERQIRQQRLQVLNRILRHNLRNKLTVVKSHAALLDEGDTQLPPGEAAKHIEEAADDLIQLSERAKSVQRYAHTDDLGSTPVAVEQVVADAVADVRSSFPEVSVRTSIDGDYAVEANRGVLVHVLFNVIENAAEHNDADDPTVQVTVSAADDSEHPVEIRVRDNGPGIPAHELAVLRDGQETDLEHASSLGLWATMWGVTQLGGIVTFEDATPRGTLVRLELPGGPLGDGTEVTECHSDSEDTTMRTFTGNTASQSSLDP